MHILNLQKRNEANPCSGFYGFFLLDVIGFWRIFQLIPWLLTISQHTSSSDVCLSFYLIGLSILKGKASEFLDMELPVLSVPVKSSNLRSESRRLCPVHLVIQCFFFIPSLVPFLALPPLPVLEIGVLWTAANWQPLFTATSCFCSLKFLPPVYTPISRSPFSPLSLIFARSQSYGTS